MLKTVVKPSSWTCARCVLRQQRLRRTLNTAATAAVSSGKADLDLPLATHSAPGSIHDDQILRQIFDSQPVWREFSQRAGRGVRTRQAGLFQNRYLTSPKGFQDFAGVSLQKCKRIVTKVLAASSIEEYKTVARDLDRLSDLLCRVIDLSDFVRSTHPDPRIQAAATQAYAIMFEYMNVLNTTTGLNDQLKRAVATPEVIEGWTEEEKTVAQILIKDFSKSAIDLPADTRQRFVNLSNEIAELGPEFVDNMAADPPYIMFDNPRMKGMDPVAVKQLTRFGKVILPTIGVAPAQALRTVEDEDVRKQIYIANRTASEKQIKILEQLLTKRAELAKSSGFHSFAEMALVDKLAKSPEAVNEFLQALARDNKSRVNAELAELLALKRAPPRIGDTPTVLNAWDKDYYVSKLLALVRSRSRAPDFLSAFFSLGTVMQGLSRLFSRLYGVRLVPRETLPGETWNDDVRRLDVIDEREGHIAVVYCDLFEREGKNPNPAHFTLRCSRRIGEDELAEAAAVDEGLGTPEEIVTDGMASSRNPEGQLYQLPTIALICDFTRNYGKEPTLLHIREVQTLFHEMGHALHSILGRTALQNVAGTRCATDFAELPSILSEHFASALEVLQLYARHWETDKPLPFQLVQDKLDFDRRVDGMETEAQILLAMLDQAYHSALPLDPSFDSTAVYHDVLNSHGTFAEPPGTRWQGFFGHLFGYGATYYSYLFDRAIAGKVWRDVFQRTPNGAVSREAGAKFREEVLQWGGGRDGWHCLAGVLNDPRLAEGGQEAMAEVGKWGVKAC